MPNTTPSSKRLFCFGFGYVADYLTRALKTEDESWRILGTTRDPIKRSALKDRGYQIYLFDDDHPVVHPTYALEDVTHILISTPPKDDGDAVFNMHAEDIIKLPNLEWIGYLSATSVYGDRGGGWVSEKSEVKPNNKRGSRRAKAEEQWRKAARIHGIPLHVFRLAGIYGPGRNALDSIRAGIARRISKPGHAFNRVHIDDIIQVLMASIKAPNPGQVYNVADDNPAESQEVTAYAAYMLGIDPPPLVPLEEANLPPMAMSFYKDNKRVDNTKIKEELGVELLHPDFKSGMQACLKAEDDDSLFG